MKVIPIRIEPVIPLQYNYIEWKLHNYCNYDCSFCHPHIKDGSRPGLSLETNKRYIDRVSEITGDRKTWISFTGGEPTLYSKFMELLEYANTKSNLYITMYTNASRTLRWWKEVQSAKLLDQLHVTYHAEQNSDYKHIADVLNLFHDDPITTVAIATHVPKFIDKSIEGFEYLYENTGALLNLTAMTVEGEPSDLSNYTSEQLEKLKRYTFLNGKLSDSKAKTTLPIQHRLSSVPLLITHNDGSKKAVSVEVNKKNRENTYNGWQCHVGMNNMLLDINNSRRGVCMIGDLVSIDENAESLNFATDPIECTYEYCHCNMDMYSVKERTK